LGDPGQAVALPNLLPVEPAEAQCCSNFTLADVQRENARIGRIWC